MGTLADKGVMVSRYDFVPHMTLLVGELGSGKTLGAVSLSWDLGMESQAAGEPLNFVSNLHVDWPFGDRWHCDGPDEMRDVVLGEDVDPCMIVIDEIQVWATTLDPRSKAIQFLYEMGSQQRKVFANVIGTAPRELRVSGVLRGDLIRDVWTVAIDRDEDLIAMRSERGRRGFIRSPIATVGDKFSTFQRQTNPMHGARR